MIPPSPDDPNRLDDPRWEPSVRVRLEDFLAECRRELSPFAPSGAPGPFAVFDWDHTLFHGDIGDAVFLHLVRHALIHRPAAWEDTSPYLTPAARAALARATTGRPRQPETPAMARELASIYLHHRTGGGAPAFAGHDPERTHPSYAWCASLLAGFTPGQVADLTREVLGHLEGRPPGATEEVAGCDGWVDWARFADPMVDLARRLEAAGLPVWIVSASPQAVVETCAARVGLAPERVIGVRNRTTKDGALRPALEACGGAWDLIPYCLGKRAWIQRIIGGRADPDPMRPDEALSGRLWFAAGDGDGDRAFLEDASRLRLVIAQRESRTLRLAREDADGRWLVNQPFFGA